MKTLVVLPKSPARQRVTEMLVRRGHGVIALADMGSACAALASEPYDLMLAGAVDDCDDTVAVCRRLREAKGGRSGLLVAVADGADGDRVAALLSAGADDCLTRLDDPQEVELRVVVAFFRDVTGRKKADAALAESEARFRAIFENAALGIAVTDLEGRILEANRPLARMIGCSHRELVGETITELTHPDDLQREIALMRELKSGLRNTIQLEKRYRRRDGGSIWTRLSASLICDGQGKPVFTIGVVEDIDARRRAEQAKRDVERALRRSESRLRNLVQNLPDLVLVVDRDSRITFANRPVGPLTIDELEQSRGFHWIAPESEGNAREALKTACRTLQVQSVEVVDVFDLWWDCRVVPLVEDGVVQHAMIICTDITERKLSEGILRKEQKLLRRLLDLQERDRRVMAYEIHDGFAQMLAGAQFNFQACSQAHHEAPEAVRKNFAEGMRLLQSSIQEARRLISGLRPPVLDELGVVAAVEYLMCEHRTADGPSIEYSADVDFDRLAPPLESAVFRIVQESLTNARRHSGTDRIRVEISERDDHVWIEVRDWGIGFDPGQVEEQRFGLQGIRERARLLGGRATVESAPGLGTRVIVRLPLLREAPKENAANGQ